VSFTPAFGTEKTYYTQGGQPSYVSDPPIYPIFWGPYWQNNPIAVQVMDISLDEVVESRGGAYLRGVDQYTNMGGAASYNTSYTDPSTPPNPVDRSSVPAEVSDLFSKANNPIPRPDETYAAPVYLVVTDPAVTDSVPDDGFNKGLWYFNPWPHNYEVIWLATQATGVTPQNPSGLNVDLTTRYFSHELVEAMSDPFGQASGTHVDHGPSFPGTPGRQIADNEPDDGNYVYRLGGPYGVLVQAFWSDDAFDKDYIVEDGNRLNMKIDTTNGWPTVNGQRNFTGGTLVIDVNQPTNIDPQYLGNQEISLRSVTIRNGVGQSETGVEVVMDGQTFDFEPGTINAIELDAANDSESIQIGSLPAGVPVTINLGSANANNGQLYTIGLGDTQAPVTVNSHKGGDAQVEMDGIQAGGHRQRSRWRDHGRQDRAELGPGRNPRRHRGRGRRRYQHRGGRPHERRRHHLYPRLAPGDPSPEQRQPRFRADL
jgi:hypothetical protein